MLKTTLNPDGTVALSSGGEEMLFTAQELEEQIAQLARLRTRMPEPVPLEAPPVGDVMVDPAYTVKIDKMTRASLLRIRDAGYGWLNFELPPQEVLHMRRMWTDIVRQLDLEPHEDFYNGPERRRH